MKTQKLLVATVIAGFLTLTTAAQAEKHYGHKGKHAKYSQMSDEAKAEHRQKRMDKMAAELGLSDSQKTQLQTLKQNARNEMKPLRDEKRALRKEMRQLDPNASDYSAKLADIANRKAELSRQMVILKGNKRQQMASILTPEQLAKKKQMRGKHKGKFRKNK